MPALNMVNLGYVLAIGLLGWVAGVHAARLIRNFRLEIGRRFKGEGASPNYVVAAD